jgi:hypothetical protein
MTQTSFNCGAYHIVSWGKGTSYSIHKEHWCIWLQGDDAAQIREDTDNFTISSALDDLLLNHINSLPSLLYSS